MIIGYSGNNQPMNINYRHNTYRCLCNSYVNDIAFHLIVFNLAPHYARTPAISKLDRNEIASGILEQAWTI